MDEGKEFEKIPWAGTPAQLCATLQKFPGWVVGQKVAVVMVQHGPERGEDGDVTYIFGLLRWLAFDRDQIWQDSERVYLINGA